MACHTLHDEAGQPVGIYCTRERKRRCYSCNAPNASRTCDGCDHILCTNCAVTPGKELDYCPSCAKPAWLHWFGIAKPSGDRAERRNGFRVWALAHAWTFLSLVKERTKRSLAEVPNAHFDAPAHVDPMTPPAGEPE